MMIPFPPRWLISTWVFWANLERDNCWAVSLIVSSQEKPKRVISPIRTTLWILRIPTKLAIAIPR